MSLIFGNAYRVNHFKESLENQCEDGVTHAVQSFCGLKEIGIMVMEFKNACNTCIIKFHDFAFTSLPGKPLKGMS